MLLAAGGSPSGSPTSSGTPPRSGGPAGVDLTGTCLEHRAYCGEHGLPPCGEGARYSRFAGVLLHRDHPPSSVQSRSGVATSHWCSPQVSPSTPRAKHERACLTRLRPVLCHSRSGRLMRWPTSAVSSWPTVSIVQARADAAVNVPPQGTPPFTRSRPTVPAGRSWHDGRSSVPATGIRTADRFRWRAGCAWWFPSWPMRRARSTFSLPGRRWHCPWVGTSSSRVSGWACPRSPRGAGAGNVSEGV